MLFSFVGAVLNLCMVKMRQLISVLLIISLASTQPVCSIRVLGIFPHAGKSHFDVFKPMLLELAKRGHNVTVISYFPLEEPVNNYNDISLVGTAPILLEVIPIGLIGGGKVKRIFHVRELAYFTNKVCEFGLNSQQVQEFIRRKEKYDVIMTEFFTTNCFVGLMKLTGGSLIGLTSGGVIPWIGDYLGNPDNPSYIPSLFIGSSDKMSFVERVENALIYVVAKLAYKWYIDIPANAFAQKYIGEDVAPLDEYMYNASLLLLNVHHSLHRPRPHVPGVIEVGGMHIGSSKKLPKNLEKWINESTHGVIYFSMGSMIKGHTFPEDKLAMFQRAFAKLKQRVLWKWETDTMPNKPNNVMIQKWMPQFDILCHPNVKAFITHGGLLGTTEAVHCGVPAIVMPQFGDQYTNAKALEASGGGVILDFSAMLQEDVDNALRTVLDPSFNKQTKELSARFKDRPMPPLETAVYWVEYVARHKGAPHLRSAAVGMPWYQYLLLDVIAFLAAVLFTILYVVYWILTFLIRLLFGKKGKPKQKKQ